LQNVHHANIKEVEAASCERKRRKGLEIIVERICR
jgi:hypothetical protein